jgi:hypothetical protein
MDDLLSGIDILISIANSKMAVARVMKEKAAWFSDAGETSTAIMVATFSEAYYQECQSLLEIVDKYRKAGAK